MQTCIHTLMQNNKENGKVQTTMINDNTVSIALQKPEPLSSKTRKHIT